MAFEDLNKREDKAKGKRNSKGLCKKFHILFFKKMIGADTHHEKCAQDISGTHHVDKHENAERVEGHSCKAFKLRPAVSDNVAHGVLHPCVGSDYPY